MDNQNGERFVTHREFADFREEVKGALHDISHQIRGIGRISPTLIMGVLSVCLVMLGMAAALINQVITQESIRAADRDSTMIREIELRETALRRELDLRIPEKRESP